MFSKLLAKKIEEQRALLDTAMKAERALSADEQTKYDALETEIKNLEASVKAAKDLEAKEEGLKKPVNEPYYAQPKAKDEIEGIRPFKNLAEQLKAVKQAATSGIVDSRLNQINNQVRNAAPAGMNEGIESEGGFAVQTDFAGTMFETAATTGQILPKVDRYEITSNANAVEWIEIDETSVASTVFGGVQMYWEAEAQTATATKPKIRVADIKLNKLLGFAYATYELEQDSNFVSQLYSRAFTTAIRRELESCIVAGNGVGKPLGFLNGGGKVSVTKESGQVAASILYKNIVKMHNRAYNKNAPEYAWLMHPDCSEQLDFMEFPIGTGGVPVYLQEAKEGSIATLKGHPIVESDHCSALGTVGDINYVDLSQYFLITKGGIQADTSMHVQFLTAQNCFRFIFRANGMPKKNSAITIKNSSTTRSSIVTLATRS